MKKTSDAVRVHEDVVVLVPGFLGFSLIGRFPYFADRVPATLAALLRERWGRDLALVPATTVPTGSLRARVEELGRFLARLESLGGKRFYLAGHSTGGVDAQLLGCTAPFWGGAWEAHVASAREKIQSVVTISAPHHGTCLVGSRAVQFLSHPKPSELGAFLKACAPLVSLAGKDVTQIRSILDLAPQQWPDAWRFLFSVLRHHELFEELRPEAMGGLRASVTADPRIALTCFATGADVQTGPDRTSDAFYTELHGFGCDTAPSAEVEANIERLSGAPEPLWIRSPETQVLRVTADTNDGVVNTARQILDGAEIGGVAVADHADVLGDYDRMDIATGEPMNTGIFRSGAEFGDDEFVELYRRVARALDRKVR
jgi:pimeloyl-ACP methyl ester carboxylesterase